MSLLTILTPLIGPVVDKIVDRIPNPNERAKAKEEIEKELVTAANSALIAQLEINKQEAAHKSIFIAGWRPFVGWSCGLALCWHFLLLPFTTFVITLIGADLPPLPQFDMGSLMTVLMGMLGLGGLRTFEKMKGVSRER